jgi:hypothetical protein
MTAEDDVELVRKYLDWLRQLEVHRGNYHRRLPLYRRFFVALTVAGLACFVGGVWFEIAASICCIFVSVCGYHMVHVRLWELEAEITSTRHQLERMRDAANATAVEGHPELAWTRDGWKT